MVLSTEKITECYKQCNAGSFEIVDMFAKLLDGFSGNVVEIGACTGNATKIFAGAIGDNSTVYVIDPWNGAQQGDELIYQKFLEHTKDYSEKIKVLREPSQSLESSKLLFKIDYDFCFIDGLHDYEPCKEDIILVQQTINDGGIIVIDDINMQGPGKAFDEAVNDGLLEIIVTECVSPGRTSAITRKKGK